MWGSHSRRNTLKKKTCKAPPIQEKTDVPSEPSGFEQTFREMFRRHAAGVAIITANLNGSPFGFTATSVASLSAEPPRFTFNMARSSSSWPAVANAEYIGVHMLGGLENQALANRFARTRDRFDGDHWEPGPPHDVPISRMSAVGSWAESRCACLSRTTLWW